MCISFYASICYTVIKISLIYITIRMSYFLFIYISASASNCIFLLSLCLWIKLSCFSSIFSLYHTIWAIKAWCIKYDTQQQKNTHTNFFLCKVTKLDLVTIVAYVGLYEENINVPWNAKKSEVTIVSAQYCGIYLIWMKSVGLETWGEASCSGLKSNQVSERFCSSPQLNSWLVDCVSDGELAVCMLTAPQIPHLLTSVHTPDSQNYMENHQLPHEITAQAIVFKSQVCFWMVKTMSCELESFSWLHLILSD